MGASPSKSASNVLRPECGAAAAAAGAESAGELVDIKDALSAWLKETKIPQPNIALRAGLINGRAYLKLFEAQTSIPFAISERASAGADAGSSGNDDVGSSAAGAAAGASAAADEIIDTPVWLDFTPTPIRNDITSNVVKTIRELRTKKKSVSFFKESEHWLDMLTVQLVALVLNGREDEAKTLIEACPYLLERRATVTDPVGRVYENVTAYEAALYAGDTRMCDMMHPFFKTKMKNEQRWIEAQIRLGRNGFEPGMRARDIRLEQCKNVFPEGVQAVTEKQHTYEFTSLIQAIDDASPEDVKDQLEHKVTHTKLGEAINLFRNDFVAHSKREQHANLKHLLEVFRLYSEDTRIAEWESDSDFNKMRVFWCQVIGFVQLYLPECDKQAFHQGLYYVVEFKERLARETDFKHDKGYAMHLLEGHAGCGFEFAAPARPRRLGGGRRAVSGCRDWKTYVKQKHQTWKDYATADKPCETMRDSMT